MKENFSKTLKIVFAAHLALVFVLCLQHLFSKEKPKTKMIVRTIQPQTQAVAISVAKNTKTKQVASIPKKISPQKQTLIKEQAPLKEIVPSKKEISSSKSTKIPPPQEITSSKASEICLPKEISLTKIDEDFSRKELPVQNTPKYGEILTTYLQSSLDLPEYGEVKVDLEIDCFGQLVRFEILEEKSKKNAEFLKKRLPELVLPCFNERGKSDETATFTITFKNSSSPFL